MARIDAFLGKGLPRVWFSDYLLVTLYNYPFNYREDVQKSIETSGVRTPLARKVSNKSLNELCKKSFPDATMRSKIANFCLRNHYLAYWAGIKQLQNISVVSVEPVNNPLYNRMLALDAMIKKFILEYASDLMTDNMIAFKKLGTTIPGLPKEDLNTIQKFDLPWIYHVMSEYGITTINFSSEYIRVMSDSEIITTDITRYEYLTPFQTRVLNTSNIAILVDNRIDMIIANELIHRLDHKLDVLSKENPGNDFPTMHFIQTSLAQILVDMYDEVDKIRTYIPVETFNKLKTYFVKLSMSESNNHLAKAKRKVRSYHENQNTWSYIKSSKLTDLRFKENSYSDCGLEVLPKVICSNDK